MKGIQCAFRLMEMSLQMEDVDVKAGSVDIWPDLQRLCDQTKRINAPRASFVSLNVTELIGQPWQRFGRSFKGLVCCVYLRQ